MLRLEVGNTLQSMIWLNNLLCKFYIWFFVRQNQMSCWLFMNLDFIWFYIWFLRSCGKKNQTIPLQMYKNSNITSVSSLNTGIPIKIWDKFLKHEKPYTNSLSSHWQRTLLTQNRNAFWSFTWELEKIWWLFGLIDLA